MPLTVAEASLVLHAIQQIDNRQWDEHTAQIWAATLDPNVTLDEALAAVTRHIATSTAWMLPAHVNAQVQEGRDRKRALLHAAGPPDYPSDLTHAEEQVYRKLYQAHVIAGRSRDEATTAADREFGTARLPEVEASPAVRNAIADFERKRNVPREGAA